MLLPSKHITLSQSIIGLAGIIIKFLEKPKNIDELWLEYKEINNTKLFPAEHEYNTFVLAVHYLFTVGIIDLNKKGQLFV